MLRIYWLPKLKRNVERDRLVNERLREAGWEVVRLWEYLLMDDASKEVVAALRRVSGARCD